MVESDIKTRDQIKGELLELNDQLWAHWDNAETLIDDKDKGYTAKQFTEDDGVPTILVTYKCEGLTPEVWQKWIEDPTEIALATNNKLTRIVLEPVDGHKMYLMKMAMPMLISNRSTVMAMYRHKYENNDFEFVFNSSRGNEVQVAANQAEIGSDVVNDN